MTEENILKRNNILDELNCALKMAGYINNEVVRKAVENDLTDCIVSIIADFNSEGDMKL